MRDEHVDDLIDLYALGALEPDEQGAVDEHLDTCGRCRTQLAQAKELVSLLAWTPDQHEPPPQLRGRLMRRVQQLQRLDGDEPRSWWQRLLPDVRRRTTQFTFGLSMALAALLLFTGLRASNLQREITTLRSQLRDQQVIVDALQSPGTRLVSLTQASGGPQARLLLDPAGQRAYLVTLALQPLPDNQTYQLWLIDGQTPVSAGLFEVDGQGIGRVVVEADQPFSQYQSIGISIEPDGGSPQPTNVVLLNQL
jgi:anti-sigma-K factor RskA